MVHDEAHDKAASERDNRSQRSRRIASAWAVGMIPGAISQCQTIRMPHHCSLSSPDFLSTLEKSGILSETVLQEVRVVWSEDAQLQDSSALARQLVEQGRLTEFQAHRLLVGKCRKPRFRALPADRPSRHRSHGTRIQGPASVDGPSGRPQGSSCPFAQPRNIPSRGSSAK